MAAKVFTLILLVGFDLATAAPAQPCGLEGCDSDHAAILQVRGNATMALAKHRAQSVDPQLSQCTEACQSLGFCCNNVAAGSANQFLSCAQACAMRERNQALTVQQCQARCHTNRECSKQFDGHSYSLCTACSDLTAASTCVSGVPNPDACEIGCSIQASLPMQKDWHLAPAGSATCDSGQIATQAQCHAAVLWLARIFNTPVDITFTEHNEATCVPLGCSMHSSTTMWSGHYRASGASCTENDFHVVCSGFFPWHLAAPAATDCDYGTEATQAQCGNVVAGLASVAGAVPARGMQTGWLGTCNDGGWGNVPLGCSAQSGPGGDWTAHYKTEGSDCGTQSYQLACSGPVWHFAPIDATECDYGTGATQSECEAAVEQLARIWVAVKELHLSYHIGETLLLIIYTHYGTLI